MVDFQLTTPVAFIIYNRPDTTERVFAEIANARPPKLLVVGDGPCTDRQGDVEKVAAARAIIQRVNWDCEVLTNLSKENLGCRQRVSSGLDWVFEKVEEAIILEDDCLPDPSFFRFCEELLEKYRYDERIMMISGVNFQFGRKRTSYSYYFSHDPHVWGWASWRRAWKKYDVTMKLWPEIRDDGWLQDMFYDTKAVRYWNRIFEKVYSGEIDTWDYQWAFTRLLQSGLSVMPNVNLVLNIGLGHNEATHTTLKVSPYTNVKVETMAFPLSHPSCIIRDLAAENYTTKRMFLLPPIVNLARKVIMSILRNRWKTNPTVAGWIKKGYIITITFYLALQKKKDEK